MAKEMLCVKCGYKGKPKLITKGNIGTEILLWIFFLIPGLIYSIWRHASRYRGCPECKETMIPLDSPVAQKIFAESNSFPSQSK